MATIPLLPSASKPYNGFGKFEWTIGLGGTCCSGEYHPIEIGEIYANFGGCNWWCKNCVAKYVGEDKLQSIPPKLWEQEAQWFAKKGLSIEYPKLVTESEPMTKDPKICLSCHLPICEVCGVCETQDCMFTGRKITNPHEMASVRHMFARTQKARGFVALSEAGLTVPSPYLVIGAKEEISIPKGRRYTDGYFIRPCPMRPRHGFVESRRVDVKPYESDMIADISKIWDETVVEDPEAEMLIMPAIDARYNLVITPTRMAIGPGHDGATAGRQGTVALPLMGVPFAEITPSVLKMAAVDIEKDDPYIEAVIARYSSHMTYITQLRAGVKIPPAIGADYIPETIRVSSVVEASGDLLEWERQVKNLTPDTVVYHVGGTLISHYGVHCIYNGIPIMTSRIPIIGEILPASPKMVQPSPDAVLKGIAVGSAMKLDQESMANKLYTMLSIAHNAAAMGNEYGAYLGVAAALMMRAGMAASHGEARHATNSDYPKFSRETVYSVSLDDFFGSRKNLGKSQWIFDNHKFRSASFGGKKWAECTKAIIELDRTIRGLVNDPTEDNVNALVTSLNIAINQAHNGGWWLDKFISGSAFDNAASQSIMALCVAGPGLVEINEEIKTTPDAIIEGHLKTWREQGEIVIEMPQKYSQEYGIEHSNYIKTNEDDDPPDWHDEDSEPDPESKGKMKNVNDSASELSNMVSPMLVQGRYIQMNNGKWALHMQYTTDHADKEYFSTTIEKDVPTPKVPSPGNGICNYKYSFAGSGEIYFPFTVVEDGWGYFIAKDPVNDIMVKIDIKSLNGSIVAPEVDETKPDTPIVDMKAFDQAHGLAIEEVNSDIASDIDQEIPF